MASVWLIGVARGSMFGYASVLCGGFCRRSLCPAFCSPDFLLLDPLSHLLREAFIGMSVFGGGIWYV